MRGEPRDERDLTARGLVRQPRDPRAALADYEARPEAQPALSIGPPEQGQRPRRGPRPHRRGHRGARHAPRPLPGLRAGACRPGRIARPARPARGRARRRPRERCARDSKPFTVYQVAGIYALTSRQNPDDRREAFRLLESALSQGFGLDLLDRDRDLDAIRDQPEFRRLVEAARARRTKAAPRATTPRAAVEPRGRAGSGSASHRPFADERPLMAYVPSRCPGSSMNHRNRIAPLDRPSTSNELPGGSHGQVTTAHR